MRAPARARGHADNPGEMPESQERKPRLEQQEENKTERLWGMPSV